MLESLDIVIGFTVVMLIFSLVATAIIQTVIAVLQLRGRNLRYGLISLLRQLDPGLDRRLAMRIVDGVVKHPLISRAPGHIGSVVTREELVQLLLGLAAGSEPRRLRDDARRKLGEILVHQGIQDPQAALSAIRNRALELERDLPDLAADVRQSRAIIEQAASSFVATIHTWFDSTMARVTQVFTAHVRIVTAAVATLLALATQLDSLQLINRLSIDKDLRAQLVASASELAAEEPAAAGHVAVKPPKAAATGQSAAKPDGASPSAAPPCGDSTATMDSTLAAAKLQVGRLRSLALAQLISLPDSSLIKWRRVWVLPGRWPAPNWHKAADKSWPGLLLSAVLLGLGAPFWFNWLRTVLSLRSAFAAKEDDQREARAVTAKAGAGGN